MKLRKIMVIAAAMVSFNVNADIVKEAQDFLTRVGNREDFWVYQPREYAAQSEEDFLKAYQYASGDKTLCLRVEEQRALFEPLINHTSDFAENHALLFLSNGKHSERKQTIQRFAKRYQLKVMTLDKSRTSSEIKKALMRFDANEQDLFLLNPKKHQVVPLRGKHPCLLEQNFFFLLYDNIPQPKSVKENK